MWAVYGATDARGAIQGSVSNLFAFSSPWCYNIPVPNPRVCLVSFTDTNGIRHAVEVAASTLYEAATLAMAEFRRCGFTGGRTRTSDAPHGDRQSARDFA